MLSSILLPSVPWYLTPSLCLEKLFDHQGWHQLNMPLSILKPMALEIAGLAQKKGPPFNESISGVVREEEQLFF